MNYTFADTINKIITTSNFYRTSTHYNSNLDDQIRIVRKELIKKPDGLFYIQAESIESLKKLICDLKKR